MAEQASRVDGLEGQLSGHVARVDGLEGQVGSLADATQRHIDRVAGGIDELRERTASEVMGGFIEQKINASRPSMLQLLDSRFASRPQADEAMRQSQMQQELLLDQQRQLIQHLLMLDQQNDYFRTILSSVVKEPAALAALDQAERSLRSPHAKHLRPAPPALFSGEISTPGLERALAGSAARSIRKSRSISALPLGGATLLAVPNPLPRTHYIGADEAYDSPTGKPQPHNQPRWSL